MCRISVISIVTDNSVNESWHDCIRQLVIWMRKQSSSRIRSITISSTSRCALQIWQRRKGEYVFASLSLSWSWLVLMLACRWCDVLVQLVYQSCTHFSDSDVFILLEVHGALVQVACVNSSLSGVALTSTVGSHLSEHYLSEQLCCVVCWCTCRWVFSVNRRSNWTESFVSCWQAWCCEMLEIPLW